jgi:nicotinamidase-related amidase
MSLTYQMKRLFLVLLVPALMMPIVAGNAVEKASSTNMQLQLRTRVQPFPGSDAWNEATFSATIPTRKTAIIITDMWDQHWCKGATGRVGLIAAKMEPLLEQARAAGVLIIHAPSDTMDFYANTPERAAAKDAPTVAPPKELVLQQPALPIDDSDGGCDVPGYKEHRAWSKQIATLKIMPGDVISDSGKEIYNVLMQHHIDTVLYMGVHANMCILNRTFGMRQMTKWGLRCILVRDLTDAMYNPAMRPFVSHAAGVELVIEYIEKYAGPTVTSDQVRAALGAGSASITKFN